MKKTINVTQEDIDNGVKHDVNRCPNALALSRELNKPCCFGVTGWWFEGEKLWKSAPQEARIFANEFDAGSPVEPYTFEVEDGTI